jgi:hypothetical protein
MKILLMMAVVQSLNPVIFAWFNRVAGLRILMLRQQLTVYRRKSEETGAEKQGSAVLVVALEDLEGLDT